MTVLGPWVAWVDGQVMKQELESTALGQPLVRRAILEEEWEE